MSYTVRKLLPYVLIGVLVLIILYIMIQIIVLSIKPPAAVEKPLMPAYGILKRIEFANVTRSPAGLTYIFDTYSGVPDPATSSAHVVFKPRSIPSFGAAGKAKIFARAFKLNEKEMQVQSDSQVMTFVDSVRRLTIDLDTSNYTFTREVDDEVRQVLDQKKAIVSEHPQQTEQQAISLITQLGQYPASLSRGTRKIIYFDYDHASRSGTVVETPQEANMVEVDFLPADIKGLTIHYEKYYTSPNYVVFIPTSREPILLKSQIKIFESSATDSSVYPLKSNTQAFKELTEGQGILGNGSLEGMRELHIKQMLVGYIEPEEYSPYMQPYFIFIDGKDVAMYIPAVDDRWLEPRVTNRDSGPIPSVAPSVEATPVPTVEPTSVPTVEPPLPSAESDFIPIVKASPTP